MMRKKNNQIQMLEGSLNEALICIKIKKSDCF